MKSTVRARMKLKGKPKFWCLILLMVILSTTSAKAEDVIKLVANEASLAKAQSWIDLLKKNEIAVDRVSPAQFESVKSNYFITIEGGMDDPAIKKLVTEAVGAADVATLSNAGAKKMFMKENVWQPGQKVLVFAGSDAEAAAAARTENRESWMKYLKTWFDLGEGPGGLKAY